MIVLVMGVCGCGKTTVGRLVAERMGVVFYDADDFHPPVNVDKMSAGIPLTDDDRLPWLQAMARLMPAWEEEGGAVLGCSALKEAYRRALFEEGVSYRIVYLKGTRELIRERMTARTDHFMPPELVDSQFATLEEPADAIVADIALTPDEIADQVLSAIREKEA